jgi:hypothetical protein
MLHRRFRHLRVLGEWFRPEPELLDFIQAETFVWPQHDQEISKEARHLAKELRRKAKEAGMDAGPYVLQWIQQEVIQSGRQEKGTV